MAKRLAPNRGFLVAAHTDSKSGHVHNRIVFANRDRLTGHKTLYARYYLAVMKDLGLEVYEPEQQEQQQDSSLLRGAPLPEITKENWCTEMRQRVDAVFVDTRVAAASTISDGHEVAQQLAGEYNVSFRTATYERKGGRQKQQLLGRCMP